MQRLELRLLLESGAWVKAYLSYDEGRRWHYAGEMQGHDGRIRSRLLAVRPVRCASLRLKLVGHGGYGHVQRRRHIAHADLSLKEHKEYADAGRIAKYLK